MLEARYELVRILSRLPFLATRIFVKVDPDQPRAGIALDPHRKILETAYMLICEAPDADEISYSSILLWWFLAQRSPLRFFVCGARPFSLYPTRDSGTISRLSVLGTCR